MSHRMFQMLKHIWIKHQISEEDALYLNQSTFGALCRRRWVLYRFGTQQGFHVSPAGIKALDYYNDWRGQKDRPSEHLGRGAILAKRLNKLVVVKGRKTA